MTPVMKRCLDAIEHLTVDGVSPTFAELGEHLGIASKSRIHRIIHSLAERGYITFKAGHARSIQIVTRDEAGFPFDRMAEAAVDHVTLYRRVGATVTTDTMRQALVEAFKSEAA